MAAGKKPVNERSAGGVVWSEDGEQAGSEDPAASLAGMLGDLDTFAEVMITREQPGYAAGFIGTWEIPDHDPIAFLQRLQSECGGQVYRVQPLRRQDNGRKLYAPGLRRVRISGPPLQHGRPWGQPPAMIDATAVARHSEPTPARPLGGLEQFAGVFSTIGERLGRLEQVLSTPAPAAAAAPAPAAPSVEPLAAAVQQIKALRQLEKLLARDQVDDQVDDDDEPEDSIESLILRYASQRMDGAAQPDPPQENGPRLIRGGAGQGAQAPQPAQAPQQAPQQPGEPEQPSTPQQGAQAVAAKLSTLPAEEQVDFLMAMTDALPPEVQAGLQAAALRRMKTDGTG